MNKISFIGSGNISHHLGIAFRRVGISIESISSRNNESGSALATRLGSTFCDIQDINPHIDTLIIAVNDDSISDVIKQIPEGIKSVVHTSGAVSINVFEDRFINYGVFYPLQSFTLERDINLEKVPVLIEANNETYSQSLLDLGLSISKRVALMSSESREHLHVAAVIANNFVNYLATEAYSVLEEHAIDGSLIRPLMEETIARLSTNHPATMQTGPAKRMDITTMKKHEKQLESNPDLQSLYRQISQLIMKKYNGSKL